MKRNKENADEEIAHMREVGDEIKELDAKLNDVEDKFNDMMMRLPNIPHETVPVGDTEDDNEEVYKWGDVPTFDFETKAHWDLGTDLVSLTLNVLVK